MRFGKIRNQIEYLEMQTILNVKCFNKIKVIEERENFEYKVIIIPQNLISQTQVVCV